MAGQVNAVAPQTRGLVQCGAGPDEVTDIGDVHAQYPFTASVPFEAYGIVNADVTVIDVNVTKIDAVGREICSVSSRYSAFNE